MESVAAEMGNYFRVATSPRRTVTSSVVSCLVFAPRFSTQEMAVALKPIGSTFLTLAGEGVFTLKNGPLVLNEGVDRPRFKRLAKNLYSNGFDGIEVRRCSAPPTL